MIINRNRAVSGKLLTIWYGYANFAMSLYICIFVCEFLIQRVARATENVCEIHKGMSARYIKKCL